MPDVLSPSILTSTKAALGLAEDYTVFDPDVILHINSTLSELNQLGVGPELGFMIMDKTATWDEVLGNELRYNDVKSWVWLKVKMLFDPPSTGYLVTHYEKLLEEYAWRINRAREDIVYPSTGTLPDPDGDSDYILDGGNA